MGQPVKRGYRAEHRARVAKLQVEATRQVVTDTGRYLFERDGYHRTTIRAIAAEAGLAEATVYFHFGSKPAILQAIVDRAAADADPFYAAVDPVVFGRAVVGAVSEATGHFLGRPGADPERLADGLCRIFAP
jgi:AcrR family transcriptional regulator